MGVKEAPVINDPYQLLLQSTSLWFSSGERNREYQATDYTERLSITLSRSAPLDSVRSAV